MPSYIYSFLYPTNKTVHCFNLKNIFKKHGLLNGKKCKDAWNYRTSSWKSMISMSFLLPLFFLMVYLILLRFTFDWTMHSFQNRQKIVTKNLSKLLKTWFDRRSIISHCKETFYLTVIDFFTKTRSIDLLLNQRNNTEAAVLRYFLE